MEKKDFLKILESDELGLLELKKKNSEVMSEDERLIEKFLEIEDFYIKNGREPEVGADAVQEHRLASRLNALREDPEKIELLMAHDQYNLLRVTVPKIESIDDVFQEDDLGILDDIDVDLFDLKNIPQYSERDNADYIAQRKPCKDFSAFEEIFVKCHSEIQRGERRLLSFEKEQEIHVGEFFVLKGVLVYIADKGEVFEKNGKINARLRVIYENGTELDSLLRSLSRELYRDGKRVTDNLTHTDEYLDSFRGVTDEDKTSGFIYVLKSKSDDPKIVEMENLYKIGFSAKSVEERVKNAKNDPTYLMAPVEIVSVYECFNMNTHTFEKLLHNFFGESCLNVDVFGARKRYSPREWFIAPLHVIEKAIRLIISGAVLNYKYNAELQDIVYRS